MSLSDLASLGSFVSGLGVLISLIFLYFQLRQVNAQVKQAERNQQAAIQQARNAQIADIMMGVADSELADVVAKGSNGAEDLTRTQIGQFFAYSHARLAISEDAFYHHKNGLLSDEAFSSFVAKLGGGLGSPGTRVMWKRGKSAYGHEFVDFVDGLIARTPMAEPFDPIVRWKSDVAAEKALAVATPAVPLNPAG